MVSKTSLLELRGQSTSQRCGRRELVRDQGQRPIVGLVREHPVAVVILRYIGTWPRLCLSSDPARTL